MRRALLVVIAMLAGCNDIFGIKELPPTNDDAGDATVDVSPPGDATPDVAEDQDAGCAPIDWGDAGPTVGMTTITPDDDSYGPGYIESFPFGARRSGCLTEFVFYVGMDSVAGAVAVYSDLGATPDTLLASGTVPAPTLGWNTVKLDKPVNVIAQQTLWLAIMTTNINDAGNLLNFRDTYTGTTSLAGIIALDAGPLVFPAKFPATTDDSVGPASMYLR
jgi:hypothetical protein